MPLNEHATTVDLVPLSAPAKVVSVSARHPEAALVLVNATQGDALAARLGGLRVAARVQPPATVEGILEAVEVLEGK